MENNVMNEAMTVDINDMSATEAITDGLAVDLLCGTQIEFDVDGMDWGDIYNRIDDLDTNIMTFKRMVYDLTHTEDDTTRESSAFSVLESVHEFMVSVGIENLKYDVRPNITNTEKAILACLDGVMILETLIHHARIYALTNVDTASLLDTLMDDTDIEIDLNNLNQEVIDAFNEETATFTKEHPINMDGEENV